MAYINLNSKKFKDLVAQDKIYVLDPKDGQIKETSVTRVGAVRNQPNHIVIEAFKAVSMDGVDETKLQLAKDMYDANVHDKFILPKEAKMALLMSNMPTVISVSKEIIEQWMKKSL